MAHEHNYAADFLSGFGAAQQFKTAKQKSGEDCTTDPYAGQPCRSARKD